MTRPLSLMALKRRGLFVCTLVGLTIVSCASPERLLPAEEPARSAPDQVQPAALEVEPEGTAPPTITDPVDGQTPPPGVHFESQDLGDATAKALRLGKFLVVHWHDASMSDPATGLLASVFADAEAAHWVRQNAIAVAIDTSAHVQDARTNRVGTAQTPCIDLLDPSKGVRIERLFNGSTSTDFLASTLGRTDGKPVARPTGERAQEPLAWLAWANYRSICTDAAAAGETTEGYLWCMTTAEAFRPGFRALYLEYCIRALRFNERRDEGASSVLNGEFDALRNLARAGRASKRDLYELTRFAEWMKQDEAMRRLVKELRGRGQTQKSYRIHLYPYAAPVLGRYRDFDDILDTLGNQPLRYVEERLAALRTDADEASVKAMYLVPATPKMAHARDPQMRRDSRDDIVTDASWAFEALLHKDRADEARALFERLKTESPCEPLYASFAERAMRARHLDLAAEFLDMGIASLDALDAERLLRLQSTLQKLLEDAAEASK